MSSRVNFTVAHPGRRLGAILVDLILFNIVTGLLLLLASQIAPDLGTFDDHVASVDFVLPFLILVSWLIWQASPGKTLLNCRIVNHANGARPRPSQMVVRMIGYLLSALPAGLGFLWILFQRDRRGFHDLLAGTAVAVDDVADTRLADLVAES